jgi:hypothetical protein
MISIDVFLVTFLIEDGQFRSNVLTCLEGKKEDS